MSEQFEGERCLICGYSSEHSLECPNNQQSSQELIEEETKEKPTNRDEIMHAYFKEHPGARFKEAFLKANDWAKDVEKNRMGFDEARDYAWKVRREAVKMKAQMEMGNEGDARDVEILENMIHSGTAQQPPKENYKAGNMIAEYEKQEKQELEKVREKLKNIKA